MARQLSSLSSTSVSPSDGVTSTAIDVSGTAKPAGVGVEFTVTCSATMDGDATLYLLGSIDGTNFTSLEEGRPLATISDVDTATVKEVTSFVNTGFEEIKFAVTNSDVSNSITVTVAYTLNAL